MKQQAKMTSPHAEVWMDDGILYITYLQDSLSLEQAKAHIDFVKNHFSDHLPALNISNFQKVKKWNKDVRNYLASDEVKTIFRATAITGANGLSKIVGNLFLKFNKPPYPTRMFGSTEKAIAWLQEIETD